MKEPRPNERKANTPIKTQARKTTNRKTRKPLSRKAQQGPAEHRGPRNNGYHTNYRIEIQGAMIPNGGHLLIIDHKCRIRIDFIQFILLVILASHARMSVGLPAPIEIKGGEYVQPSRIHEIIDDLKAGRLQCGGYTLNGYLQTLDTPLIHNAKWELRRRLKVHNKKIDLLDGIEGAGYLLSLFPGRIKIRLVHPSGDRVWDWTA